ncbi:hypothetical protein J7K42_02360 [bacterium]|nr:hypothetical protein [bacterium]
MIIGHQTQWQFLKRIARTERIPQAMLFSGQEHLGKRKVALEFIKLLNCPEQGPCQKCFSCLNISKQRYPDLTILRPKKKQIQISQIRELQNVLNLGPQLSFIKSVIIDDAETMNLEAQNCLLKTLEEPKGRTLLILISANPEMLTQTIISRTQLLKFYPLSFSEMEEYFKERVAPDFLEKLLFLSGGLPGKAMNFFENPQELEKEFQSWQLWQKILDSKLYLRFSQMKKFFSQEEFAGNLGYFLEILLRYLRAGLLRKLGIKERKAEAVFGFSKNLQNYSLQQLKKMIKMVDNLKFLVNQTNINARLALENLLIYL